jgi:hypothetical protein
MKICPEVTTRGDRPLDVMIHLYFLIKEGKYAIEFHKMSELITSILPARYLPF